MTLIIVIAAAVIFFSVILPVVIFFWSIITLPIVWLLGAMWEHKVVVSLIILGAYGIYYIIENAH